MAKSITIKTIWTICLAAALVFSVRAGIPAANSNVLAEHLKCEWRVNPVGVDTDHPHFSWTLRDLDPGIRGITQSAYEIEVALSPLALAADRGGGWDSGKISSSQMFQVEYGGRPLLPASRYYWKVRVWDNHDHPSAWSDPAEYTTALIGSGQWIAHWIASEPDTQPTRPDPAQVAIPEKTAKPLPIFRYEFASPKKISHAIAFVAGLGQYEMHINGQNVTDNILTPGWSDYRKRVFYDTYDVTNLLKVGQNAIGILLGNGMYNVPAVVGRYTKFVGSYGQPKLILQIHLAFTDGTTQVIISDKTWMTSPGPITFSHVYGGEDYDARLEQVGWDTANFSTTHWHRAVEVSGPGGELDAEQAPPIKVLHTYEPVKSSTPVPAVTIFDLGQNFSGWPQITVRGRRGGSVKLVAGELLDPAGFVTQRSANAFPQSQNRFSYTLRGGGDETWHPRFSTYGFRYVQVESVFASASSADRGPEIVSLKGEFIHDDVAVNGNFQSSNRLLGQIHQLIDMAVLSNMVSVLTDCPHREKLGWLEQTHLAGTSILLNYDGISLYRKMAQDMRDSQLPNGIVPGIAPEYVAFADRNGVNTDFRDSPEWGSAAILSPWIAYQFYGDRALLAAQYPTMKKYAEYLRSRATDNILAYGLGDWYDIGPGEPGRSKLTDKELTPTAIYYEDLGVLSKVAKILGEPGDSAGYAQQAERVKNAFNARLFHPRTEQYGHGSQTANAMPLALGMVPAGHEKAVLQQLVYDIRLHGNHVTAGDIGFHYVVRALTDGGRSDVLNDMLSRTDSPSYGYQLANGATTLTEAWDTNPNSSQNHFMLGHAEEWFYRGLAGISVNLDQPDQQRIEIRPIPVGKLASASATYDSVFGQIRSSWTHEGRRFTLRVTIPPNSSATIEIPTSETASVTESNHALDEADGISHAQVTGRGVVCRVVSGEYWFNAEL